MVRLLTSCIERNAFCFASTQALGAIGSPQVLDKLRSFEGHSCEILRESCWVALHMYDREAFLAAGITV